MFDFLTTFASSIRGAVLSVAQAVRGLFAGPAARGSVRLPAPSGYAGPEAGGISPVDEEREAAPPAPAHAAPPPEPARQQAREEAPRADAEPGFPDAPAAAGPPPEPARQQAREEAPPADAEPGFSDAPAAAPPPPDVHESTREEAPPVAAEADVPAPAPARPQARRAAPPICGDPQGSLAIGSSAEFKEAAPDRGPESPPSAAAKPGFAAPEAPPEPEPVLLGGSAPRKARPGDVILAQFAAYVARFEDQARRALEREAAPGEIRLGEETDCRWAVGARVTVRCTARGLTVFTPTQSFVWDGDCRTVSFDIEVPADAQPRDTVIVMEAFVHDAEDAPDAVPVGRLRMSLEIGNDADDAPPQRVQAEAARTAFASYASEDRIDVLERVSSIRRSAGLEVFVDVVSLRMGDDWETRLREQIASSDRFLLFWSEHAAGKKWVTWEWEQALNARGEDALELHLLRHTPIGTIPERLRRYHFDDVYLRAIDAERYRRGETPPAPDA